MENVSLKEVRCLGHNCVRIEAGDQVIYTDPYQLKEAPHDGTLILITHDHYDHLSPEDIEKVAGEDCVLALPESCDPGSLPDAVTAIYAVIPGGRYFVSDICFETVPSYNIGKAFHSQENEWVGYVVEGNGLRYYIAGDMDRIPEAEKLSADVAFLPVGGTYTMTAEEAAGLAAVMDAKVFVPVHYGIIVGTPDDADRFVSLVGPKAVRLY